MLMMDHMAEIDHIMHDLERIEEIHHRENNLNVPMDDTSVLVREIMSDFTDLLRRLELEEFEHSGVIYDSEMINKMCLSAYYMSSFGHSRLFNLNMTLEETCEEASRLIGCNPEALIHMKSLYDSFFENIRQGRKQDVILSSDMIRVMRDCEAMTEEEVALECRKWFRKK